MTTAATVLFDFLPVEEMLNVAEAVIRVFHARGDYQHKQRNRMKFLIKSMGWDAFRAAFDDALAKVRAEGGRPLEFDDEPAGERSRAVVAAHARRRRLPRSSDAWTAATLKGPGIIPARASRCESRRPRSRAGCERTSGRRSRTGYATATVTVPLGDLSGAQFRVIADLAQRVRRRHGARHRGAEPRVPLGAARRRGRRCTSDSQPPASACRMPTRSPTSRAALAPSRASSR